LVVPALLVAAAFVAVFLAAGLAVVFAADDVRAAVRFGADFLAAVAGVFFAVDFFAEDFFAVDRVALAVVVDFRAAAALTGADTRRTAARAAATAWRTRPPRPVAAPVTWSAISAPLPDLTE
jgi:hypothetical protein